MSPYRHQFDRRLAVSWKRKRRQFIAKFEVNMRERLDLYPGGWPELLRWTAGKIDSFVEKGQVGGTSSGVDEKSARELDGETMVHVKWLRKCCPDLLRDVSIAASVIEGTPSGLAWSYERASQVAIELRRLAIDVEIRHLDPLGPTNQEANASGALAQSATDNETPSDRPDDLITQYEAANFAACSEKTIWRRVNKDKLLTSYGGKVSKAELESVLPQLRQRKPRKRRRKMQT